MSPVPVALIPPPDPPAAGRLESCPGPHDFRPLADGPGYECRVCRGRCDAAGLALYRQGARHAAPATRPGPDPGDDPCR